MCNRILAINLFLHDTVLINTDSCEKVQDSFVHCFQTINNKGNGDSLPARNTFLGAAPPVLGLLSLADVTDIQHDTVQGARVERLVLVVRGDGNEELGLPIIHLRAQGPAGSLRKLVGVTGSCTVAHMTAEFVTNVSHDYGRHAVQERTRTLSS